MNKKDIVISGYITFIVMIFGLVTNIPKHGLKVIPFLLFMSLFGAVFVYLDKKWKINLINSIIGLENKEEGK